MLYDILPPLVFLFSLGGIIFLVARVSMRVRRVDLESSISAAAATPAPNLTAPRRWLGAPDNDMAALLRPSQKGVRVITSRMGLLLSSAQTAGQAIKEKTKQLPANWRARLPDRQARRQLTLTETETETIETITEVSAEPEESTVVTPVGGVVLPVESPRQQRTKQLMGRLKSVTGKVQERSQQQLEALKQVAKKRLQAAPKLTPVASVISTPPVGTPVRPTLKRSTPQPTPVTTSPVVSSFRATGFLRRGPAEVTTPALEQVKNLMADQNFELAEELLLPHIVKHPKDTTAYLLLGEIALAREAWDEAQEVYEQILRINPQTRGTYAGLGLAAYRAGNFTKALQMLQRALNEDPTNREVLEAVLSLAQKLDNKALQHSIEEQLQELDQTVTNQVQV